jgi:hypothetical protein
MCEKLLSQLAPITIASRLSNSPSRSLTVTSSEPQTGVKSKG